MPLVPRYRSSEALARCHMKHRVPWSTVQAMRFGHLITWDEAWARFAVVGSSMPLRAA